LEPKWYHIGIMVSMSLKNIPEDLMQDLKQAAAEDCRSLNQEVLYLLKSVMSAKASKNEAARYKEAYLQHPENPTELSSLSELAKQNLADLPWDDT
jgi:plasmid stability protein